MRFGNTWTRKTVVLAFIPLVFGLSAYVIYRAKTPALASTELAKNNLSSSPESTTIEALIRTKENASDSGERQRAIASLYQLLEEESKFPEYVLSLEETLTGTKQDLGHLEELSAIYASPFVRNPTKELEHLRRYLQYTNNPGAMMRLSELEALKGNTERSHQLASEAAVMDPTYTTGRRLDGASFLEKAGDKVRCSAILKDILNDPDASARGLMFAANSFYRIGELSLALDAYTKGEARADADNIRERCRIGGCKVLIDQGKGKEIQSTLQQLSQSGSTTLVRRQAKLLLNRI